MSATTSTAPGTWTFDGLGDAELPLDVSRYEVVDGHLVVRPEVTYAHNTVAYDLARVVDDILPPGWRARSEVGVALGRNGRRADFGVVRASAAVRRRQMGLEPAGIAMLGEIVSPGSKPRDRVVKPAEYARAGIAAYWRLELDPEPLLVVHRLIDGAYVPGLQLTGRGAVSLMLGDLEVSVELDLPALLPPLLD